MVCTGVWNFCSAKTCIVIIASCYYDGIYPQAQPDIWDVTQGWFSVLKFQNGSSWKSCQNLHVVWLYSLLVTKCIQEYQQHYCKSKTLWAIVRTVKQQPKPAGNTHPSLTPQVRCWTQARLLMTPRSQRNIQGMTVHLATPGELCVAVQTHALSLQNEF